MRHFGSWADYNPASPTVAPAQTGPLKQSRGDHTVRRRERTRNGRAKFLITGNGDSRNPARHPRAMPFHFRHGLDRDHRQHASRTIPCRRELPGRGSDAPAKRRVAINRRPEGGLRVAPFTDPQRHAGIAGRDDIQPPANLVCLRRQPVRQAFRVVGASEHEASLRRKTARLPVNQRVGQQASQRPGTTFVPHGKRHRVGKSNELTPTRQIPDRIDRPVVAVDNHRIGLGDAARDDIMLGTQAMQAGSPMRIVAHEKVLQPRTCGRIRRAVLEEDFPPRCQCIQGERPRHPRSRAC
jgi:hypothetical protein